MISKLNFNSDSEYLFWQTNAQTDLATILNVAKYQHDWMPQSSSLLLFYDDFDQHLRLAEQYLVRIAGQTLLTSQTQILKQSDKPVPGFATEFEQDDWRTAMSELIGLRKLENQLRIKTDIQQLELRDDEHKCVARAVFILTERGIYASLEPVRGYAKAHKQLYTSLSKLGFTGTELTFTARLLELHKEQLPETVTPATVKIKPDDVIGDTVCKMCISMIDTARSHENGVLTKSQDTEFLHDYRVSLRKTRSLVSLMKSIFPADAHQQIKQKLAEIMRPTNAARDLDVYLLEQADYEQMLPEELRAGLPAMFNDFKKQHIKAYQELNAWLSSSAYGKEIENCQAWFAHMLENNATPQAQQPVLAAVNQSVLKKYRKILKLGRIIHPETPDEQVHDLRLECKKFRYLLDFFAPLYPKAELSKLMKKLKKMQNTLGAFNDYSVQQEALHDYLNTARPNKKLHMSVGALILVLAQKQTEQRQQVEQKFAEFAQPATSDLVQSLFSLTTTTSKKEITA